MSEEIAKAENATVEAFACAVRAYVEFALAVIKHFVQPMKSLLDNVNEYYAIQKYATPNERRMMHHRKKRIRRKYYNRVKRRICK